MNKKLIIIATVIILVAAALLYYFFGMSQPIKLSAIETKNGNITEQIYLTGQVKASQGVDLAFESQGKIIANYVKVGDKIYTGQPLLAIDSSTLQAQLGQAQAQLDALNLDMVNNKITTGLQSIYASSLNAAQKSVSVAKDILFTISDIQYNHFTTQNQQNINLQDAKSTAVNSLLGQTGTGLWTSQAIGQLNGGAFGMVQNAINNPTHENIDIALSNAQASLQTVSNLVNIVPIDPSLTQTERASLSLAKTNINAEVITTSANIQAIATLKVNNSATVSTTDSQIEAAKANVDAIQTQISKTVIRALFNGQVDKDNTIVGQIVNSNVPVITISNNNLEIDTNISEIDLADAKVGGKANITLDAFGTNVIFPATIYSIDSAPTVVNGISVYGAKLKFDKADDRIKTGMTANITVTSETHTNVIIVPESAVINKNNQYFVIIDKGNSQREARQVTVGLKDGTNIEITSGLKLGEKILAY